MLLEKIFYSDILPGGQPMGNHSECDDCFAQLQSMLSPKHRKSWNSI